jgi:HTH-type transcriptional regulator/antitoxin HigA
MVVRNAKLDPIKYGRLCARTLPKVIASDEEFERMGAQLEELCMKPNRTVEECALADLLTKLISDYDEAHFPIEETPPHEMVAYLMEQRGLKPADLVGLIGSRAHVSGMISGKRAIDKAQARKLAAFFNVSTDLFL